MKRHIFFGIITGAAAFALCVQFSRLLPEVRCADGWRSPSIGRQGACSWHGGVRGNGAGFVLLFSLGVGVLVGKSVTGRFAPSKGEQVTAEALTDLTGTEKAQYGSIADPIVNAIRTGRRVSFIYRKRGSAVCEVRTILPREFRRVARPSTGSRTLCVVGFCEKRRADRTFAVELMSDVRIVGSSGPSGYKQG